MIYKLLYKIIIIGCLISILVLLTQSRNNKKENYIYHANTGCTYGTQSGKKNCLRVGIDYISNEALLAREITKKHREIDIKQEKINRDYRNIDKMARDIETLTRNVDEITLNIDSSISKEQHKKIIEITDQIKDLTNQISDHIDKGEHDKIVKKSGLIHTERKKMKNIVNEVNKGIGNIRLNLKQYEKISEEWNKINERRKEIGKIRADIKILVDDIKKLKVELDKMNIKDNDSVSMMAAQYLSASSEL